MNGEIAIRVDGLGKQYKIGGPRVMYKTLRDSLTGAATAPFRLLRSAFERSNVSTLKRSNEIFWALKDISFEIKAGEAVGIIGRNGAGKSTLLKILSRITEPSCGAADIYGRVGSLLEVGTGFHPELTGRENTYLNGAILGMTRKEIVRRLDEIVDFAEIEKFLDTPVKHYSTGMYLRLAFAVAAHLEPEILLVDEVLAVGDAAFQKKCLGKMGQVAGEGRTVLFVSHNMAAIQALCPQAIYLEGGKLNQIGPSYKVIENYLSSGDVQGMSLENRTDRNGNGRLRVTQIKIIGGNGYELQQPASGQNITLQINYIVPGNEVIKNTVVVIVIKTHFGQPLFICSSRLEKQYLPDLLPSGSILCHIPKLPLNQGTYIVDLYVKQGQDSSNVLDSIENALKLDVGVGDFFGSGRVAPSDSSPMLVAHNWSVAVPEASEEL